MGGILSKDRVKAVLKAYLVFAVGHSIFKLHRIIKLAFKARKYLHDLPGFGEAKPGDFLRNWRRIHDWRLEQIMKYPGADMVVGKAPGVEILCVSEDSVKWMLKDEFGKITKQKPEHLYLVQLLEEFIGHSIFLLRHGDQQEVENDHAMWYTQRKAASKIFTKNNFTKSMGKTFMEKANRLVEVIRKDTQERGKKEVQMEEKFFCFTMDSIQKIFFNREVDSLDGKMDEYARAFDEAHHNMMAFFFKNVPIMIMSMILLPFPFSGFFGNERVNMLMNFVRRIDSNGIEFQRSCDFLNKKTLEFVRETRADPNVGNRDDLLARIMNAKGCEDLTDKQLRDVILNFIIAGRDTTACTLTWLFYELTQNLDVQEALIAEIDSVLQGRDPTLDDFSPENMPILNGVFYEALRLHPPVPEDVKQLSEDAVYKGRVIPAGTRLHFSPYSMNRMPDKYPNPLKFDPNRWIPFNQPNDFAFPVFQAGPRFCLGRHMAQFEAKLLTCKLLQNFRFKFNGDTSKISYSLMITMSLTNDGSTKESNELWLEPQIRHEAISA